MHRFGFRGRRLSRLTSIVAATAVAATLAPVLTAAPAQAAPAFVAYHDQTAASHQDKWNTLPGQGYRPISLSVYGDPASAKYAAVWVQRTGPAYAGVHGLSADAYASKVTEMKNAGYLPTIVSATGAGTSLSFAAVFEKVTNWASRVGMSPASFVIESRNQRVAGRMARWVDVYGTDAAPLIAATFAPSGTSWISSTTPSGSLDNAATMQEKFNGFMSTGNRLSMMATSNTERFLGIYTDDVVSGGWIAAANLTAAEYQAKFNELTPSGWYPVAVDAGGGTGFTTRFSAVFQKTETIVPRAFSATGTAIPSMVSVDNYIKTLMTNTKARSASLAITKNGKLVYARGFNNAEAGYPAAQPTSMYRVASCSKPITSVATHQLIQEGKLTLNKRVRPLLGLTTPSGGAPADSRLDDVTVDHLLYHAGGWNRDTAGDVVFKEPDAATANSVALPVNKLHVNKYATGQSLQFTPGEGSVYSNYGIGLAGQVIEKKRATTYTAAVKASIWDKLGASRPQLGRSLLANKIAGEVRYEPAVPSVDRSVLTSARPFVGRPYGSWTQENLDAFGGWVMAAPDYAKMLAAFDLGSRNPLLNSTMTNVMWSSPPVGYYPAALSDNTGLLRGWFRTSFTNAAGEPVDAIGHNGSLPGTACLAMRRADGISFVLLMNRDLPGALQFSTHGMSINNAINAVTTWPTTDQFPAMGLPAFS